MRTSSLLHPLGLLFAFVGFAAACYSVGLPFGKVELLPLVNAPLLDDQTLANYNLSLPAYIRWIAVAGAVSSLLAGVFRCVRLPMMFAGILLGLAAGPIIELTNDLNDLEKNNRERDEKRGYTHENLWKKVQIKSGTYLLFGGAVQALLGCWLLKGDKARRND